MNYPIKNRLIKIALIGCGRISKNHIKSIILHHERAELVAICDQSLKCLKEAQKTISELSLELNHQDPIKPQEFLSFNELINSAKKNSIHIDLVVLTTPSGLHAQQCIEASKAGIHVCTEKPMATKWEDGNKMVRTCEKEGTKLFVVKQNRFNSTLQLLKKQIDNGRFGTLALVICNILWHRPQSYYDTAEWRGTWEYDGGALMNQASHYVDLMSWLFGPIESVTANIATLARSIEAEDTATVQLKWENGALGSLNVTMLTYPENLEGSITVLGNKGTVKIGGPAVNVIEKWQFADSTTDDELVDSASYETTSVYGMGHPIYYRNMLDDLNGIEPSICDGTEGLKSLELIIASYLSARSHKKVYLPLQTS